MKYHLFTGITNMNRNRWVMFVYENDETCVQTWDYQGTDYPFCVHEKDHADIPISKRIYILATGQGKYKLDPVWTHKEMNEKEALELFWEVNFMED